jgi:hypothetical protein
MNVSAYPQASSVYVYINSNVSIRAQETDLPSTLLVALIQKFRTMGKKGGERFGPKAPGRRRACTGPKPKTGVKGQRKKSKTSKKSKKQTKVRADLPKSLCACEVLKNRDADRLRQFSLLWCGFQGWKMSWQLGPRFRAVMVRVSGLEDAVAARCVRPR